MRDGRASFVIGLIFVSLCLVAADVIGRSDSSAGYSIERESLTIVGWVAMWRPLQIFLYDWWPLHRQIRRYHMLSSAHVQVVQRK